MFSLWHFTCNSGADFVVTKSCVNFLFVSILRSRKTNCCQIHIYNKTIVINSTNLFSLQYDLTMTLIIFLKKF